MKFVITLASSQKKLKSKKNGFKKKNLYKLLVKYDLSDNIKDLFIKLKKKSNLTIFIEI